MLFTCGPDILKFLDKAKFQSFVIIKEIKDFVLQFIFVFITIGKQTYTGSRISPIGETRLVAQMPQIIEMTEKLALKCKKLSIRLQTAAADLELRILDGRNRAEIVERFRV